MQTIHNHNLSAKSNELKHLFLDQLETAFAAETLVADAFIEFAGEASSPDLKEAIEAHREETLNHVQRLEKVFGVFSQPIKPGKNDAMLRLVASAKRLMSERKGSPGSDAGLIGALQKVEHYEIALYGCLAAWGRQLREDEAVRWIERTLAEEKEADERLTILAEDWINRQAVQETVDARFPVSQLANAASAMKV